MTALTKTNQATLLLGLLGLAGAILVGFGECLLQYAPDGHYNDPAYGFFADIPRSRLISGHFIGVLAAPLYLAGYGFLARLIRPAGQFSARAIFIIGASAFMIGAVWYGQRAFIALAVQDAPQLVQVYADLNEPFVNVLRAAMLLVAIIWARAVWSGRTNLPKWMAAFSPLSFLIMIFALWLALPSFGSVLLASAMNFAHAATFALCLLVSRRA